jgi:hypothetical protein
MEFKDKFHAYCSLASPHLGIVNAKTHIKVGLWVSKVFTSYD